MWAVLPLSTLKDFSLLLAYFDFWGWIPSHIILYRCTANTQHTLDHSLVLLTNTQNTGILEYVLSAVAWGGGGSGWYWPAACAPGGWTRIPTPDLTAPVLPALAFFCPSATAATCRFETALLIFAAGGGGTTPCTFDSRDVVKYLRATPTLGFGAVELGFASGR